MSKYILVIEFENERNCASCPLFIKDYDDCFITGFDNIKECPLIKQEDKPK